MSGTMAPLLTYQRMRQQSPRGSSWRRAYLFSFHLFMLRGIKARLWPIQLTAALRLRERWHHGNLRNLRERLRQDVSSSSERQGSHLRQLRMRDPCVGAHLRALRHPYCRSRPREGGHLLLLRALRQRRRRTRPAGPNVISAAFVLSVWNASRTCNVVSGRQDEENAAIQCWHDPGGREMTG